MKTEIKIFTSDIFGEIRTCQVNNQIMFVGKDVATALGYSNSRKALLDHVDDEDKTDGVTIRDAIVAVRLGISYWKINLKALDKAYSIAFPNSTPINVNKKKKKR